MASHYLPGVYKEDAINLNNMLREGSWESVSPYPITPWKPDGTRKNGPSSLYKVISIWKPYLDHENRDDIRPIKQLVANTIAMRRASRNSFI